MDRTARPHLRTNPARAAQIINELRAIEPDSPGLKVADALLALGHGERQIASELIAELLREHPDPDLRHTLQADQDLGPLLNAR